MSYIRGLRRLAALAMAGALAVVVTACGDDDHGSGATVEVPEDASFNGADVSFAQGMIPHHRQAVAMAELALANTTTPAITDLANRIKGAQDPEIVTMQGWLRAWGQPETMGMDDGGHGTGGMMSEADMAELAAVKGVELDRRFLEMMIEHHEGAVDMAEQVKEDGEDAGTRALADAIIEAQHAEIAEMQSLLQQS